MTEEIVKGTNMIKKWMHGVIFLGLLVLLLLASSWVMTPKNNTYEEGIGDFLTEGYLAEPIDSLDVLFVGDSVPRFGICPPVIWQEQGIPSYVCSGYAKSVPYMVSYLRNFLRRQSPKIVVLDADVLFRKHDVLDWLHMTLEYYFPVLKFHNNWKLHNPKALLQPEHYDNVTWEKGYYLWKDVEPWTKGDYMASDTGEEPLAESSIRYLKWIMKICEKRGARLMLVSVPSPQNMSSKKDRTLNRLAGELELPYLNLSLHLDEMGIDWATDTPDKGDHLNWWGAQKVSRYLAKALADTGLLTDRRGTPGYEAWDSSCAAFFDYASTAKGNVDIEQAE